MQVTQTKSLSEAVAEAGNCINSLYPLTNFIACNALKGLESMPFAEAMRMSGDLFGAKGFLPLSEYRSMYESGRIAPCDLEEAFANAKETGKSASGEERVKTVCEMMDQMFGYQLAAAVNRQMVKWCGAYLDRTQSQWKPQSPTSLYLFWKELARHDLAMSWHGIKNWRQSLDSLPNYSQETLANILYQLNIEEDQIVGYLRQHIVQLPGFASHLKWRESENGEVGILTDYLAIRLHYEKMLAQVAAQKHYKSSDLAMVRPLLECEIKIDDKGGPHNDDYGPVWQDAYELNYRNRLLSSLRTEEANETNSSCQIVFCIDVRSEPIRRKIEQLGPYSTYGFAGFFGMSMRLTELGSQASYDLCPVLLKPDKAVLETADEEAARKKTGWQALKISALQLKKKLKCNLAGTFGMVETLGLCSMLPLLLKTFIPGKCLTACKHFDEYIAGQPKTRLDLSSFSLANKIAMATGAIKGMGLTNFGKLVVLCGHKSTSFNNPFASSLDCGACGGNGGGYSARLAAAILNDQAVRSGLLENGIEIPQDTVFLAAEHDTSTDQFSFFDTEELMGGSKVIFDRLKNDLACAGASLRKERASTLPESCFSSINEPRERACDWAQVAPEWGLAGNAAFIAAPRSISKEVDLQGRVFLHSYEYSQDPDNKILELIMTAPLVVAQWINTQYYLSSVDNDKFGSGSKVFHNVIGDFGVMQGASSDLKMGLPLQSIGTGDKLRHEPMRLLAVLRAPISAIDGVLQSHPQVRQLVSNHWIRLVALDPESETFFEARDYGIWHRIEKYKLSADKQKEESGIYINA